MTTFEDGPAAGQILMLKRAPHFLRVTKSTVGTFDALDQLSDVPFPNEELFGYVITAKPGWMHVKMKKGGGFCTMAKYRLADPQPYLSDMNDAERWRAWCLANFKGKPA